MQGHTIEALTPHWLLTSDFKQKTNQTLEPNTHHVYERLIKEGIVAHLLVSLTASVRSEPTVDVAKLPKRYKKETCTRLLIA